MRGVLFLFVLAALLVEFGCREEDDGSKLSEPKSPPYHTRETILTLEDEPGTVRYYCGTDTAFIYLGTDDPAKPSLIMDEPGIMGSFLFLILENLNIYYDPCYFDPPDNFQDRNFPVLISGDVKAIHPLDSVGLAFPFVLESFFKYGECPIDSLWKEGDYGLHGIWQIQNVMLDDELLIPTCEYNDVTIDFQYDVDSLSTDTQDYLLYDLGDRSCQYHYRIENDSVLFVGNSVCTLGFVPLTHDMRKFQRSFFKVLIPEGSENSVRYKIENNWLTITNDKGDKVNLFK